MMFLHGALGIWDEVVFVSIIIIFLVLMAMAWLRGRDEDLDAPEVNAAPSPQAPNPERFELE